MVEIDQDASVAGCRGVSRVTPTLNCEVNVVILRKLSGPCYALRICWTNDQALYEKNLSLALSASPLLRRHYRS
jgi:hypothetical protein